MKESEPCRDQVALARDAAQAKREQHSATGPVEPKGFMSVLDPVKGQQVVPPDPAQQHLGGYVVGGDDATWYPDLWKWLVKELEIKSVLDVGCGEGQAVDYFFNVLKVPRVFGLDGLPQPNPLVETHDFTKSIWRPPWHSPPYDLIWCCEFVEHIEEEFMSNFLEVFKLGRYVAITHADPGQQGHHHVNCRINQYWIGVMAASGFKFEDMLTKMARVAASANPNPYNHFKRSGLVFKKYEQKEKIKN